MIRTFLVSALVLTLVHAALELLGARAFVSVLSGSLPGDPVAALLGLAYALSHFAFVIAAPILVLASGLLTASRAAARVLAGRR